MRFKLHGRGGQLELPAANWKRALELARAYGWKPEGTDPPDIRDQDDDPACDWSGWSGTYTECEYQHVRAEDAANLADALELALLDIPQRSVIERDAPGVFSGVRGVSVPREENPIEWFHRPARRAELVRLMGFCRTGGFEIG